MRCPQLLSALALSLSLGASAHAAAGPFDDDLAERRAEVTRLAGQPEAIVPLLGMLDLWNHLDDRAPLDQTLDTVAADPRQLPEIRARARYLRSILLDREGRRDDAAKARAELGLVEQWMVIGPFDNEGRSGYAQKFAPEAELASPIDLKKTVPGKERAVSWRVLPRHLVAEGLINLEAALRPSQNVVGYATTWLDVPRATDALLRTGSSGAIVVWIDGRRVLGRDVYHPVRFDQDVAAAHLGKGLHRITVKIGAADAGWAFFLRLTDLAGRALDATPRLAPQAAVALDRGRGPSPKLPPRADLRGALAGDQRALGLYLHYVAPDDPEAKGAEKAMQAAAAKAPSTRAYRELAMVLSEPNERRKALEQALVPSLAEKATPRERARALVELGESYAHARRERLAEGLWHQALVLDPEYFPADLKLAELVAERGLPSLAAETVERVAKKHPTLAAQHALAQLAETAGQRAVAETIYQRLVAADKQDSSALRSLFTIARNRGDVPSALALLDRLGEARPEMLSVALDRAELLDGVGRTGEAHAVLARALADCPDEPRLLERDGRVLHRLGKDEHALAEMRRSLELRPQNPDLRTYLRQLESDKARAQGDARSGDDLARAWAVPFEEVIRRTKKAKPPVAGDAARVLLDLAATRVHQNGLSESFSQRVVEILDEKGAREQGDVAVSYTPDTQTVEIKQARVYKKTGEIIEAPAETDRDLSEPWYGLYYDVRAQVIQFDHLEPGDVIDVEYVVSDIGGRNLFADYFGQLHLLQEELPRVESDYVLITPRSRAFYFNQPRLPDVKIETRDEGDERVYIARAHDVPKVQAEAGMPGITDVAAYVHVSTYKTWEDVAQWYRGLVAEQLLPDDNIRQAVAAATKGVTDERARIQHLYDLVVQKTRYVGLEFGIHGYKPYRVSQIYARKFGDCKDKASLLVAMLREIGVEATLVLARTRRGGDLDPYPASLAPFDHAIVYVPKYDLYLDGTAEFSGSTELPAQDQDIPVLLVSDPRVGGKGRLVRTPVLAAEQNVVARNVQVKLAPTGDAEVTFAATVSGEVAHEWRSHYQSPGERVERFEKAENAAHPGARVVSVEFPSLEDLERPVEVKAQLGIPSWARQRGGELAMPALGHDGELLRSYARLSARQSDLILGFPWKQAEQVTLVMPPCYAPKRLPEARRIDGPFGSFTLDVARQGQEVRVSAALRVVRHRITRSEYEAFRRFCSDVDAAMGQELVLAHE